MDKLIEVKNVLSKYHHEYLLKYCDLAESKEKFLDEILNVDFELQKNSLREKSGKSSTFIYRAIVEGDIMRSYGFYYHSTFIFVFE